MKLLDFNGHVGDEIRIGNVVLVNNGDWIEVRNSDKSAFAPVKVKRVETAAQPATKDYADTQLSGGKFYAFLDIFYSMVGRYDLTATTYEEIAEVPFYYSKFYSLCPDFSATFFCEYFENYAGSSEIFIKLVAEPIGGGSAVEIKEWQLTSSGYELLESVITTDLTGNLDSETDYLVNLQMKQAPYEAGNHGIRSASIVFRK